MDKLPPFFGSVSTSNYPTIPSLKTGLREAVGVNSSDAFDGGDLGPCRAEPGACLVDLGGAKVRVLALRMALAIS
jgi:hypothetical protein